LKQEAILACQHTLEVNLREINVETITSDLRTTINIERAFVLVKFLCLVQFHQSCTQKMIAVLQPPAGHVSYGLDWVNYTFCDCTPNYYTNLWWHHFFIIAVEKLLQKLTTSFWFQDMVRHALNNAGCSKCSSKWKGEDATALWSLEALAKVPTAPLELSQ
jgi:hypothetical protein